MSLIDKNKFDPVVEPTGDKVHRLVRAAIGTLPVLSGTALEALNSLIDDPYNTRRTEWLHELSDVINELGDDVEVLKDDINRINPVLSAIVQSTDVALKTGDKNIHKILIRIIAETIKNSEPKEELISIYLSTIRQITSSHLVLLQFISFRKRYEHGRELQKYEANFFEEVKQLKGVNKDIPPERLLNDLVSFQLIYSPPNSPWSSGCTNYCTMMASDFALGFINYIK